MSEQLADPVPVVLAVDWVPIKILWPDDVDTSITEDRLGEEFIQRIHVTPRRGTYWWWLEQHVVTGRLKLCRAKIPSAVPA